ncbi:hypothetical protein FISHEDRAFT_69534 [Fistulina hepatica ATCC 64428]|uniref:Uncharacterized protein n=1 Tax=Fistulina hepatica ATCC 64428 TaxID=1128425 RepID=A0A0D7ALV2_9AGAR|nr:hypothetical protein FISHEDRAFT_69534 [Fistulina hepatica ATCC 64428]
MQNFPWPHRQQQQQPPQPTAWAQPPPWALQQMHQQQQQQPPAWGQQRQQQQQQQAPYGFNGQQPPAPFVTPGWNHRPLANGGNPVIPSQYDPRKVKEAELLQRIPIEDTLAPDAAAARRKISTSRHRQHLSAPPPATAAAAAVSSMTAPFKSALKARRILFDDHGDTHHRQVSRIRRGSNAAPKGGGFILDDDGKSFDAVYLFLTFLGEDTLRLENAPEPALTELNELLPDFWPYHAVMSPVGGQVSSDSTFTYHIKFSNCPWRVSNRADRIETWDLIIKIFQLFIRRGYACEQAMNLSDMSPRIPLAIAFPIGEPQVFLGFFSNKDTRLTLVRPPRRVEEDLGWMLKERLMGNLSSDQEQEGGIYRIFDIKTNTAGQPCVDPPHFMMHVLTALRHLGYKHEVCVPLVEGNNMFRKARRDVMVFRVVSDVTLLDEEKLRVVDAGPAEDAAAQDAGYQEDDEGERRRRKERERRDRREERRQRRAEKDREREKRQQSAHG